MHQAMRVNFLPPFCSSIDMIFTIALMEIEAVSRQQQNDKNEREAMILDFVFYRSISDSFRQLATGPYISTYYYGYTSTNNSLILMIRNNIRMSIINQCHICMVGWWSRFMIHKIFEKHLSKCNSRELLRRTSLYGS